MTGIRSILLHVDGSRQLARRVAVARQLAQALDARVLAQHAMTPSLLRYPLAVEGGATVASLMMEADQQALQEARSAFEQARQGDPRLHCAEKSCDPLQLRLQALYSDLVIVGQRDPDDAASDEVPVDFVQSLVIDSGKPVLVVPHSGTPCAPPQRVMVAWKETRESARAVAAALPLLRRARQVFLSCYAAEAATLLANAQRWLASHGVTEVVLDAAPDAGNDAGELLLSRAADTGAEMLVMGCYGHSRSREWILGGVTRTLLRSMTTPVLMVH